MPDVRILDQAPGVFAGIDTDKAQRLSVAEIQQALRELRARDPGEPERASHRGLNTSHIAPVQSNASSIERRDSAVEGALSIEGQDPNLSPEWIIVVAAHPGAGASTVALALSDAASAAGRTVHLVENATVSRSGLVAAAASELGTDASGEWRRGAREYVTLDRRGSDRDPAGWPLPPAGHTDVLTVIDLGSPAAGNLFRLSEAGCRTVVACRVTVPGVRAVEQLLEHLSNLPTVIAALGGRRWPSEVTGSLSQRLRALRASGRVVRVPTDRGLQVVGLTHLALPKPVQAAGRSLLALLEDDSPIAARQARRSTTKGSKR